jgi:hypothetical protein
MKSKFPLTNDHRLIGHISKIFNVDVDDDISSVLHSVDTNVLNLPLILRDLLVVYETFPVFGEFMFPKPKSHLWQLLESTDSAMLLTDPMLQGKDSLFICQAVTDVDVGIETTAVISKQCKKSICVNTYKGKHAILYPLNSF